MEEKKMKKLDRIILLVLAVGVWGLIGMMWLKPSNVDAHADGHTHESYELYGIAKGGHTHTGSDVSNVAKKKHTHDYADSYHSHDYAESGHSHECLVYGEIAYCD
jgi:hypothetical protein